MEQIIEYGSQVIVLIGALAFVVSVITQVTKELPLMDKLPTNLQVIVTAMVLSVLVVIIYCQYTAIRLLWYYIVAALVLGFFVAFVAMFGWSELNDLWQRYKK